MPKPHASVPPGAQLLSRGSVQERAAVLLSDLSSGCTLAQDNSPTGIGAHVVDRNGRLLYIVPRTVMEFLIKKKLINFQPHN